MARNRITLPVCLSMLLLIIAACSPFKRLQRPSTPDITTVAQLLSGRFHNEGQSRRDERVTTTYLHVVPIWPNRPGQWLYWERRSTAPMRDTYEQRILQVLPYRRHVFELRSYNLPDTERFRGRWMRPAEFEALTLDSLSANAGCSLYLRYFGGAYYRGGTRTFACVNADSTAHQAIDMELQPEGILWMEQWRDLQNEAIPMRSDSMVSELRRIE